MPVLRNADDLDHEKDDQRQRDGGVEIGGRRSAERQAERLERDDPELVQQEDEDERAR